MKYDYIIIICRRRRTRISVQLSQHPYQELFKDVLIWRTFAQEHILVHLLMELVTLPKEYS